MFFSWPGLSTIVKDLDMTNNDPLHGITLKTILTELVEQYGWEELGRRIDIRCFTNDPSIASSLKFLRRTPWARDKVETMYISWRMGLPD